MASLYGPPRLLQILQEHFPGWSEQAGLLDELRKVLASTPPEGRKWTKDAVARALRERHYHIANDRLLKVLKEHCPGWGAKRARVAVARLPPEQQMASGDGFHEFLAERRLPSCFADLVDEDKLHAVHKLHTFLESMQPRTCCATRRRSACCRRGSRPARVHFSFRPPLLAWIQSLSCFRFRAARVWVRVPPWMLSVFSGASC